MNNKFGIEFTSQSKGLISQINKLSNSMEGLGKAGRRTSGDFRKFQKETRKLNDMFSNMNRDGNRTTKVIKGMKAPLFSVGNAIKGVMSYKISNYLYTATRSAMDMIETTHLFEVSMGSLAVETDNVVKSLNELSGLDVGNLRDRIGTFNMLGLTMGFAEKNAQTLALGMNQLALDMGALFNVPYQQIAEDLRSGLIGQSRTLYKYGLDVTEAAIANEALALGISKSVRHMTQGEKMMLRYSVLIKQASRFQGDFAETFNTPMNQLRILQERFVTLSRTIGKLFIPAMGKIVIVANAVTLALINITKLLGTFLGINMKDSVKDMEDGFSVVDDELNDGLDKAGNKIKKIKKSLMGFDELNILQEPVTDSGGSGLDLGGGSPLDLDLSGYDALLDGINDKAQEIANDIMDTMKKLWDIAEPTRVALKNLWEDGLSKYGSFTLGALGDFYTYFLKPIGEWTVGTGLPKLLDIFNSLLSNIDWDRLREALKSIWEALAPFAIAVGEGLLWFLENVLVPLGIWVSENIIIPFFEVLGEKINLLSEFVTENHEIVGTVIGGILLFVGAWKLVEGILLLILPLIGKVVGVIGAITSPIGLAIISIGLIVGALALAYDKFEGFREVVHDWGKALAETFKVMYDDISELWTNLWEGVIKPVFDRGQKWLSKLWNDTLKKILKELGDTVTEIIKLFKVLWEHSKPYIDNFQKKFYPGIKNTLELILDVFGVVFTAIGDVIAGAIKVFKGIIIFLSGVFSGDWKRIFEGLESIVVGIFEAIANVIKGAFNIIISILNSFIRGINLIHIPDWVPGIGGKGFSIKEIPLLADGGVLSMGQLFVAREAGAELVGNFGGKTGVMNNEQIIDAVSRGVYDAVKSAMGSSQGNDGGLIIQIGERTILDTLQQGVNRETRINGKSVIRV